MIIGDMLQHRLCTSEGVYVSNFSANEEEMSGVKLE